MANVHDIKPSGVDILENPVSMEQKSAYVQGMFDTIAGSYDFLNLVLSFGIHKGWRKFAIRCASLGTGDRVLDACSGTGDFSEEARRVVGETGDVVPVDFSLQMLRSGSARYSACDCDPLQVDILALPFADSSFDAALIAFGLRNVADPAAGIRELTRVVRPGGRVVVLEFASPKYKWFNSIFDLYSNTIMPTLGGVISGKREAYSYLPQSVKRWLSRRELTELMLDEGLISPRHIDLTFGIACVHVGAKPQVLIKATQ